jgi:hypothetical protein
MTGRNDDGTIRFQVDPRLRGPEPMKAPAEPGVSAKPDHSFRIMGQISSPSIPDRRQASASPPPPSPSLLPSQDRAAPSTKAQDSPHRGAEARRQRLHRERVRDGFICVTIPIHASEVDGLLIARQLLKPELRNDRLAVADALCDLLETL